MYDHGITSSHINMGIYYTYITVVLALALLYYSLRFAPCILRSLDLDKKCGVSTLTWVSILMLLIFSHRCYFFNIYPVRGRRGVPTMAEHEKRPLGSIAETSSGSSELPLDPPDPAAAAAAAAATVAAAHGGTWSNVNPDTVEDPELPPLLPPPMSGLDPNNDAVVVSSHSQRQRYAGREHEMFERRHAQWRDAPSTLRLPESVEWWTAQQVAAWVKALGWSRHSSSFLANNINGEALLMVDHQMLKDIGVSAVGDRLLLLRARSLLVVARDQDLVEEEENAADNYSNRSKATKQHQLQLSQYHTQKQY